MNKYRVITNQEKTIVFTADKMVRKENSVVFYNVKYWFFHECVAIFEKPTLAIKASEAIQGLY